MILVAALLLAAGEPVPLQTDELQCAGGIQIFFERGSARIDPHGASRLDAFVNWSRGHPMREWWRIESGGDGPGTRFDAALSRRRSAAIRDYLRLRDYRPQEVVMAVQDELAGHEGEPDEVIERMGWVTRRIRREDEALANPPGMPVVVLECW